MQKAKMDLWEYSNTEKVLDECVYLAQGVSPHGENVLLSNEDYDRYQNLVNILGKRDAKLITGFNWRGNAILDRKYALKSAISVSYHSTVVNGWNNEPIMTLESGVSTSPSAPDEARMFSKFIRKAYAPQYKEYQMYLFTTRNRGTLIDWFSEMHINSEPLFYNSVIVNLRSDQYMWISKL